MTIRTAELSTEEITGSFNSYSSNERPVLRQTSFQGIISQCPSMQRVFTTLKKVAQTNSTVLVLGESGTGKELIAKAIHKLSGRSGKLVPVNCGAIPEDILESELFGHERGAFTGAVSSKLGRFQLADEGTIFLDEIGEMSPKLQVKLLRVLQERKVEPVGSTKSFDINVRVIAATNKDLREEVKAGRFREDLYYRLQVVPVELPALRERKGDISLLARYFMDSFCSEMGKSTIHISEEAANIFENYAWPGNVRELENLIERLSIMTESNVLRPYDLPEYMGEETKVDMIATPEAILPIDGIDFNSLVNDYEVKLLSLALERTNWNKKAAAKLLNLNRTTLVEKLKKKGLEKEVTMIVEPSVDKPFLAFSSGE